MADNEQEVTLESLDIRLAELENKIDALTGTPQGDLPAYGFAYACGQIVGVRAAGIHVGQELFPLRPEPVGEFSVVGDLLPLAAEVFGRWQIRIPDRHRRTNARLDATAEQAGHCGAVGSIYLELDQFAAINANRP